MIPRDTVDKIIDAARVEDVVGEFVSLRKRGANLLGLCPFHGEKTPSFTVSPVKGIYKCFGCGKAGNSVNFVMDHLSLSYPEALKWLAGKYGIEIQERELTPEEKQIQNERESLFIVMKYAAKFYQETMMETDEGKSIGYGYFKERGLSNSIIEKFQLGYSFNERKHFTNAAIKAGYQAKYLVKTGMSLVKGGIEENPEPKPEELFDRYVGRVMFPIHDDGGRVVAFGGRTLTTDKKVAKYINSPETPIYNKSRILYGLWMAKKAIQQQNVCYLVEGYMDVIAMHQAGVENVVASSGTSLTIEQIKAIHRFTENIVVLYDSDEAGQKASDRAIPMLLEEGMNVKLLLFPDNHDPDSFSRDKTEEEFKTYLEENQIDFLLFKARKLNEQTKNDPIKKATLAKDLVGLIALIPDHLTRSVYIKHCSVILEMDEQVLQTEVNVIKRKNKPKTGTTFNEPAYTEINTTEIQQEEEEELLPFIHEESELLRVMVNYGNVLITMTKKDAEDNEYDFDMTVVEYILQDIFSDEIEFIDPLNGMVLSEVVSILEGGAIPTLNHFVHHENPVLNKFAIDCSNIQHQLSDKWSKFGVHITDEKVELKRMVDHLILSLKEKKLSHSISEHKELLKSASEEDIISIQEQLIKWENAKRELNKRLGRIITK
ncbi:MAG: DNA primase [Bacteroidia bacterium]